MRKRRLQSQRQGVNGALGLLLLPQSLRWRRGISKQDPSVKDGKDGLEPDVNAKNEGVSRTTRGCAQVQPSLIHYRACRFMVQANTRAHPQI